MSTSPWQKKLVNTVIGQDDVPGNRSLLGATPESTHQEQILTLIEGNMKVKNSKWTIPNRQVLCQWMDGRADQLQAGLDSEEDAFEEGSSKVFLYAVQLSLGRYIAILGRQ